MQHALGVALQVHPGLLDAGEDPGLAVEGTAGAALDQGREVVLRGLQVLQQRLERPQRGRVVAPSQGTGALPGQAKGDAALGDGHGAPPGQDSAVGGVEGPAHEVGGDHDHEGQAVAAALEFGLGTPVKGDPLAGAQGEGAFGTADARVAAQLQPERGSRRRGAGALATLQHGQSQRQGGHGGGGEARDRLARRQDADAGDGDEGVGHGTVSGLTVVVIARHGLTIAGDRHGSLWRGLL